MKKPWHLNWPYTLALIFLSALVILSIITIVRNMETLPDNAVTGFYPTLFTGMGMFIFTAVFLPKFILNETVKDKVEELRKELNSEKKDFDIEIYKTEAHDNRMNAYFLMKHGEHLWAFGWAIKAYKQYLKLLNNDNFNVDYEDLIEKELGEKIIRKNKKPLEDIILSKEQSGMLTRQLKDFYDVRVEYIELEKNKRNHNNTDLTEEIMRIYKSLKDKEGNNEIWEKITLEQIHNKTPNRCEKTDNLFKKELGIE
ncbi:hypothetical protein DMA11_00295 [Marinilabiliaceae bacterium JC017]|nr:hypothetical protein DMA11_00295 [Marinilabiliaceae bacterium JC017]